MDFEIKDLDTFEIKVDRLATVGLWMQRQLPLNTTVLELETVENFLKEVNTLSFNLQYVRHEMTGDRGVKINKQLHWLGHFTIALSSLFLPNLSRLRINVLHSSKTLIRYDEDIYGTIDFQINFLSGKISNSQEEV